VKVLVISEPGNGGVFTYVEALCRFLLARGVELHFAYSDRRGGARLDALVRDVARAGGSVLNLRTSAAPQPADAGALLGLLRMALRVRPDVIHSQSSKAGALARALRFAGVPAQQVYHPHAFIGMRPERGRLDFFYNGIERLLGGAGHIIASSRGEWEFATRRLRISQSRVHHLPNGVETTHFCPASPEEKLRLRRDFGLPADGLVLGFMGRSSSQKDPVTLYRAFARAVSGDANLHLFHVGRGELDFELECLAEWLGIADRVVRLPFISEPEKFYQAIDGFILPSKYEGFSLGLIEALSADLPLIVSDAPGNRDLAAESLSHFAMAAPGDVNGFANAISNWAASTRSGARTNHRFIAQSRFELESRLEDIIGLYERLVECEPRGAAVLKPV